MIRYEEQGGNNMRVDKHGRKQTRMVKHDECCEGMMCAEITSTGHGTEKARNVRPADHDKEDKHDRQRMNTSSLSLQHWVTMGSFFQQAVRGVQDLDISQQVGIVNAVLEDGRINALACKICLASNWNLQLLEELCTSQSDREVVTFLRYGWPINRDNSALTCTYANHASANKYPQQMTKYLMKELEHGTLLGPFVSSPFPLESTGTSPMSMRPKRGTMDRRVIVDLSWPIQGNLVNLGISKEEYLEVLTRLRYPTTDDLCKKATQLKVNNLEQLVFGWKKGHEKSF